MTEHAFHADDVDVSPKDVKARHDAGEIQLIDVREDYEHEAGRIAGARHIELERVASQAPDDRQGPPRRLLLPPRRALGDGRQRLPPRRLGGLLDGRRASRRGTATACRWSPRTGMSRITRALLALVLLGARWRRREPPPHRASCASATSTSPSTSPRRRTTASGCSSSSGAGWSASSATARPLAAPFLDLTAEVRSTEDERGLLSIAFAPDYERSGLFYVYLTAEPAGEIQVREYRRSADEPGPRRPDGPDRVARGPRRGRQPQRRPARLRPRRDAVVRHRRRRRPGQPVRPRARPRQPAREDAADRPAPRQRGRLHGPGRQPVRHRAVGLRPAQPVPLLLRHARQQGPLHRRRRPGRARGDRPGALRRRPRQGRRLRLVLPRGHDRRADALHARAGTTSRRSSTTRRPARAR